MPDLTTETRRTCVSNLRWQKEYPSSRDPNVKYRVYYGPVSTGPYSHNYACDCPAGVHGRPCKHVKQAEQDRCGWGWEAFAGDRPQPNADNTCPNCGEPTEVIKVGV
jgi:hypothetical protein